MNHKHRKATKAAFLALAVCLIPLSYLGYQYQKNIVLDVTNFGFVPNFTILFNNNPKGMTHHDTEHHLTVVAVAKDKCLKGCPTLVARMNEFKSQYQKELSGDDSNENTPLRARFIVQAENSSSSQFPMGWDIAEMSSDTPYLVPEVKKASETPAFVLIDDAGYYRAYLPASDPQVVEKLSKELNRMVSNQYLMYYVTRQTLMWEKSKRQKSSPDDNQTH